MNNILKSLLFALIAALVLAIPAFADDFTPDLDKISIEASKNKGGFDAEIAAEFGIPIPKLNEMRAKFGMKDGDIYMACELGKQANKPIDDVIEKYNKNKSKGWGFIAKEMGIKPGSPEFKALKAKAKGKHDKMKEKGKGKGKGKSEEKGKKK